MAQCYCCKSETELYDRDRPVCLECCEASDAKHKEQEPERMGRSFREPPEARPV